VPAAGDRPQGRARTPDRLRPRNIYRVAVPWCVSLLGRAMRTLTVIRSLLMFAGDGR
jgi:hypothetical protein